jgi:hypothetical protein
MFFQSIKFKLIFPIAIGFILTAILIYSIVGQRLIEIIDQSQDDIYTEKLNVIHRMLDEKYDLLERTLDVDRSIEFGAFAK